MLSLLIFLLNIISLFIYVMPLKRKRDPSQSVTGWTGWREVRVGFASSSRDRRVPMRGYTTQLNSSRFPRAPNKSQYNTHSRSIRKRHRAQPTSTGAVPASNPRMRVCACFTSAPRMFADSKLCRTMPAEPLSLADYKTRKNVKSPRMPFCRPVMEIVDTLTSPYPANWNMPLFLPKQEKC